MTFGLFDSNMIGVDEYFNLGGELGCKEDADGNKEENYDFITETFPVGTADDVILGLCDCKMINVTDSSKRGK